LFLFLALEKVTNLEYLRISESKKKNIKIMNVKKVKTSNNIERFSAEDCQIID